MNACGVDLQPPRLPTRITRAFGASVASWAFARSSSKSTSARSSALAARIVSRSRSPGPALNRVTLPVTIVVSFTFQQRCRRSMRGGGRGVVEASDFRHARAADAAAAECRFQFGEVRTRRERLRDLRLCDLLAVADHAVARRALAFDEDRVARAAP